jgi:hypothetical protein
MKNFQLTLVKDVLKKEYKWLDRDFKKGEQVHLFSGSTYGCIGKNGIACGTDDIDCFFELPVTALAIKHENKEFGIFMTESAAGYQLFFCKEFPIDHMDLLTKTQSNVHLVDSKKSKPEYKTENQILKVMIKNGNVAYNIAQLEDVAPLF